MGVEVALECRDLVLRYFECQSCLVLQCYTIVTSKPEKHPFTRQFYCMPCCKYMAHTQCYGCLDLYFSWLLLVLCSPMHDSTILLCSW